MKARWEYMTIYHEVDDVEHDKNSAAGWEMITAFAMPDGSVRYIWKRELAEGE